MYVKIEYVTTEVHRYMFSIQNAESEFFYISSYNYLIIFFQLILNEILFNGVLDYAYFESSTYFLCERHFFYYVNFYVFLLNFDYSSVSVSVKFIAE